MSVILDALKKLDREKSSRRNEPASIAVEILKPDVPLSRRRRSLSIAIGILMIITTAAVTYTVIAKFGFLSKSSSPVPANLSAPGQKTPSASQEAGIPSKPPPDTSSSHSPGPSSFVPKPSSPEPANPSAPRQQVEPAPVLREPVRDGRSKISQMPPEIEDDTEGDSEEERALSLREEKVGRTVTPGRTNDPSTAKKKRAEPTVSGSSISPPSLKLSAIVWYEEPAKRFAVINGVISYEGSVVEGAKVVEIYPDRVRFLQNDRHFEVPMFK